MFYGDSSPTIIKTNVPAHTYGVCTMVGERGGGDFQSEIPLAST